MITYGQNFEDVILERAFSTINDGFYIDVGANDPELDSVTKHFYDKGWCGINIEPVKSWYEQLTEQRPNDINLNLGASDREGELVFYEFPDTGLSTLSKSIADKHIQNGFQLHRYSIKVMRLDAICQQYVKEKPIHFLKIDVEGHELEVLKGLDLSRIRPWMLVIEITEPLTMVKKNDDIAARLIEYNYEWCYCDGINQFFVAAEAPIDRAVFANPPNCFDHIQLPLSHRFNILQQRYVETLVENKNRVDKQLHQSQQLLEQQKNELDELAATYDQQNTNYKKQIERNNALQRDYQNTEAQNKALEKKITQLSEDNEYLDRELERMHHEFHRMHAAYRDVAESFSYRVGVKVKKILAFKSFVIGLVSRLKTGLKSLIKLLIKPVVTRAIAYIAARPQLIDRCIVLAQKRPRLSSRLLHIAGYGRYVRLVTPIVPTVTPIQPDDRAAQIYQQLTFKLNVSHKEHDHAYRD